MCCRINLLKDNLQHAARQRSQWTLELPLGHPGASPMAPPTVSQTLTLAVSARGGTPPGGEDELITSIRQRLNAGAAADSDIVLRTHLLHGLAPLVKYLVRAHSGIGGWDAAALGDYAFETRPRSTCSSISRGTYGFDCIFFVIPLVGLELGLVLPLGLPRSALDVVQPVVLRFRSQTSSGFRFWHDDHGVRSHLAMAWADSCGPHGTWLHGSRGRGRGGVVGGSFKGRVRCGLLPLAGARLSHGR